LQTCRRRRQLISSRTAASMIQRRCDRYAAISLQCIYEGIYSNRW
jgi:hypothetical protein